MSPHLSIIQPFARLLSMVVALAGLSFSLQAQVNNHSNPYLETRFLKDSLETSENSFAFNSLTLRNTSGRELNLTAIMEGPCFINIVSQKEQSINLKPGETFILPVRFAGNSKNSCAPGWTPFTIKLIDPAANLVHPVSFGLKPSASVKWKVNLAMPVVIINDQTENISFAVRIENYGNVPDHYKISFANEFSTLNYKEVLRLEPGESRVEKIDLKMKVAEIKAFERKDVTVFFENATGERKVLIQKISRIENIFHANMDAWHRVPVTFEVNSVGLMRENPYHFLKAFGNLVFNGNRMLNFNLQTPGIHMDGTIQRGASPFAEYITPKFSVAAGLLYETNQFVVFGNGVRFRYTPKSLTLYEVVYNKAAFSNIDQAIFKMVRPVISNAFTYSNNTIANFDHKEKNAGAITTHKLAWQYDPTLRISFESGFGLQKFPTSRADTLLTGPMASIKAEKVTGRLEGIVDFQTYSKSIPGIYTGYTHYIHDIRWKIKKYNIGSFLETGNQQPLLFLDSAFKNQLTFLSSNISLRLGYNGKTLNVVSYPGVFNQKQDSANSFQANMKKITTSLYWSFLNSWQVSLTNNIGTISIPTNKAAGKIFSMFNFLSVQSKQTGLFIRYDVGPYYYRDIREYVEKGVYKTIFQAAPFYNLVFPKINLDTRTQLNILFNKPGNDNGFMVMNNVMWSLPEKGFSMGINTNIDLKYKESSFINLVLRQNVRMPVYKKKAYKNFNIVLFKDADGNGLRSDSETVISNAQVIMEGTLLQTNEQGQITVLNYAGDKLKLDLSAINNLIGWVPVGGYKQDWPIVGNAVIYIPFKKSKMITGKLVLDKDEKSTATFELEGIRITAVGTGGATFTTLTGGDGLFYLNVVDDEYIVSINQNVFDENFKIIDPVKKVDLVNNRTVDVVYVVRQKRREIIIKKE